MYCIQCIQCTYTYITYITNNPRCYGDTNFTRVKTLADLAAARVDGQPVLTEHRTVDYLFTFLSTGGVA